LTLACTDEIAVLDDAADEIGMIKLDARVDDSDPYAFAT
jgi:hypothetical protein